MSRQGVHARNLANLAPVPEDMPAGSATAFPRSHDDLRSVPMEPLSVSSRKQRVITVPRKGAMNALNYYGDDVDPKIVLKQRALLHAADRMPHMAAKRWLIRRSGVNLGENVSIDMHVLFSPVFTKYIEIEDDAVLGVGCLIASHQYGSHNYEIGRVRIGKGACVGAHSVIAPGVVIGEGAALGPGSIVTRDVPPYEFWAGSPARRIADHRS